jgi:hypothetical protein
MKDQEKLDPYKVPKYAGAILIDDEYRLVKRSDGIVYLYDTKEEAQAMLRLAYPDIANTHRCKVIEAGGF